MLHLSRRNRLKGVSCSFVAKRALTLFLILSSNFDNILFKAYVKMKEKSERY